MAAITGLKVKDFLILEDIEITPDSKLNIFAGKNKNGKTSVIKAIKAALKGISDPSVIRHGAERTELQVDIEGLKIRRTMNRKGNGTLKVITPAGDIKASPQAYLDGLLSDFSFDPLTFIMLEGKERTKYIRELFRTELKPEHLAEFELDHFDALGAIDFSRDGLAILKELETHFYTVRSERNKQLAQKKALYESYPKLQINDYEDIRPTIKEDLADAEKRLTEANAIKKQAEGTLSYVKKLEEKIVRDESALSITKQQIDAIDAAKLNLEVMEIQEQVRILQESLEQKLELLDKHTEYVIETEEAEKRIADNKATLAQLPSVKDIPDIAEIETKVQGFKLMLEEAESEAQEHKMYLESQTVKKEYEELKTQSDSLTAKIDILRKTLPEQLSKEANIPIPNLRFEGDKVFIGDKNINDMSTSEQIGLAVQIVEAFNKDKALKLICIDRAESLDDQTLLEFVNQIPDEYQFFLTLVQHEGAKVPEGAYLVEAGKVGKA